MTCGPRWRWRRPGRSSRRCPAASTPASRRAAATCRAGSARALVRKPGIYLFDDSFSALDLATDARLRAALAPVVADAVTVIVAQRVSTIMNADQILVIEDGREVGLGTHRELLEHCPTYAEIVASQLTAEEAA